MKALFIALMGLMLTGCLTAPYQPQPIAASGAYTQAPTGISFPVASGIFRRVDLMQLDPPATHILAGYNSELVTQPIVFTAYIYPGPSVSSIGSPPEVVASARKQLLIGHYKQQTEEILRLHPGGNVVNANPASLIYRGQTVTGLRVDYTFNEPFQDQVQALNSSLYLFDLGDSILKFRVTAPAGVESEAPVAGLMAELAGSAL